MYIYIQINSKAIEHLFYYSLFSMRINNMHKLVCPNQAWPEVDFEHELISHSRTVTIE